MSIDKRGGVRVNHGRWARRMAGIIAGVGMLATLPAQAAAIPPVYELQLIPFDDLVIPVYAPFQPVGTPYYADFNGDGITDLFIQAPTSDGKSYIFLGRADGTYGIAAQSWSGTFNGVQWGADVSNIYLGDFNADGRADIILEAKTSGATSAMLFSSANGQFNSAFQTWVQQYPVNPNPNPYTTTTVGATAGSFAVGPSGAATYNIPISVPPGINGMQPGIALNYNSQGGNGVAGVGWSISGLSTITRCGATIDRDGFKGGVNLDGNDKLCLDGQRLVPVSTGDQVAASGICANQTEYRTEMESFTRIIACGTKGSGPEYFKVWSKNGALTDYGNSTDSAVTATNTTGTHVLTWAINRTADTNGNYMTFSYVQADGTYYIKTIDYAGNSSTVTAPNRKVIFDYTTPSDADHRVDIESNYTGGALAQTTYRLKAIRTQLNSKDVHKLDLTFKYSLGTVARSRVDTIQECNFNGSATPTCFNATSFAWTDSNNKFNPASGSTTGATILGTQFLSGDFNGDGKSDLVQVDALDNPGPNEGPVTALAWLSDGTSLQHDAYGASLGYSFSHRKILTGDFDGDGRTDILIIDKLAPSTGTIYDTIYRVYSRRPNGFTQIMGGFLATNAWDDSNQFLVADTNGDGRSDIIEIRDYASPVEVVTWLAQDNTSGFGGDKTIFSFGATSFPNNHNLYGKVQYYAADINGDGRADLLIRQDGIVDNYLASEGVVNLTIPTPSI